MEKETLFCLFCAQELALIGEEFATLPSVGFFVTKIERRHRECKNVKRKKGQEQG